MSDLLTISGSPSAASRSAAVLGYARAFVERQGLRAAAINVRDLPPEDLIYANFNSGTVQQAQAQVRAARAIAFATPVYKAAYTGVLKTFLDLLPSGALDGKVVLPIVLGGSAAHSLALDYALKPVLAALGAQQTLGGVYLIDAQVQPEGDSARLDDDAARLLDAALEALVGRLR